MSDPPSIRLQRAIAEVCAQSSDENVVAFSEALMVGGSLEPFGFSYAPWLHGHYEAAAKERRDRAICELGAMLTPQASVERRLERIFAEHKPLPDSKQEALRQAALGAHAVLWPGRTPPISRDTIRRARRGSGGKLAD